MSRLSSMDDVGITSGCAIMLVAKIRMMKLKTHSARPCDMVLAAARLCFSGSVAGLGRSGFRVFLVFVATLPFIPHARGALQRTAAGTGQRGICARPALQC